LNPYLLRRALLMIPTFLGITLVTFFVMKLAPGDPVSLAAGDAMQAGSVTREAIEHLRRTMGWDEPLWKQYAMWFGRLVALDFGTSFRTGESVLAMIGRALPVTLALSLVSVALSYLVAIPLGVYSAVRQDSFGDRVTTVVLFVLYSLPSFWVAIMLVLFLGGGRYLDWFPIQGLFSQGWDGFSLWEKVRDVAWHAVLPVTCLTYGSLAQISRYMRTGMLEVVRQDYIRTARAKGASDISVNYDHALRNAVLPVVTIIGIEAAFLIGGLIVTETVFNIPGVARFLVEAIRWRDYPIVQNLVMFIAIIVVFINFLIDLTYVVLDPRIKYEE
jgi:peptide/nickel transport system permease protein